MSNAPWRLYWRSWSRRTCGMYVDLREPVHGQYGVSYGVSYSIFPDSMEFRTRSFVWNVGYNPLRHVSLTNGWLTLRAPSLESLRDTVPVSLSRVTGRHCVCTLIYTENTVESRLRLCSGCDFGVLFRYVVHDNNKGKMSCPLTLSKLPNRFQCADRSFRRDHKFKSVLGVKCKDWDFDGKLLCC